MTPPRITCAYCGKEVKALTCFCVSPPVDGTIPAADLCSADCLREWATDRLIETVEARRKN